MAKNKVDTDADWLMGMKERHGKVANNVCTGALVRAGEELAYLEAFYQNADFGPAHEDVVAAMNENISEEGITIPSGYQPEE